MSQRQYNNPQQINLKLYNMDKHELDLMNIKKRAQNQEEARKDAKLNKNMPLSRRMQIIAVLD